MPTAQNNNKPDNSGTESNPASNVINMWDRSEHTDAEQPQQPEVPPIEVPGRDETPEHIPEKDTRETDTSVLA